jgi:hypothetical protein
VSGHQAGGTGTEIAAVAGEAVLQLARETSALAGQAGALRPYALLAWSLAEQIRMEHSSRKKFLFFLGGVRNSCAAFLAGVKSNAEFNKALFPAVGVPPPKKKFLPAPFLNVVSQHPLFVANLVNWTKVKAFFA